MSRREIRRAEQLHPLPTGKRRTQTMLALGALLLGLCGAAHAADDTAPKPAAPPAQNDTVHGFSKIDPECLAWSNGCVICARDEKAVVHCSTPGIACTPVEVSCKVSKGGK